MEGATVVDPLGPVRPDPAIAALPKVDLHVHQEWSPRLDRVLARRERRPAHDWTAWRHELMAGTAPGMPRLRRLSSVFPAPPEADEDDENFIARLEDLLAEAAADGAVLVEVRLGNPTALRRGFLDAFYEAERRVRRQYPRLRAALAVTLLLWDEPERLTRVVDECIAAAPAGLGGIDLLYEPYDTEADWTAAYRIAERAAAAGLGITAHAGEFSPANVGAALRTPGLTRLGHAVHAATNPRLLELVAESGATVECCLTCNVVLGAVPSYEDHPIRCFTAYGIPVVLGTDDPVQLGTIIGREYALAAMLGFSPAELRQITVNAVRASFLSADRKRALLAEVTAADPVGPRKGELTAEC